MSYFTGNALKLIQSPNVRVLTLRFYINFYYMITLVHTHLVSPLIDPRQKKQRVFISTSVTRCGSFSFFSPFQLPQLKRKDRPRKNANKTNEIIIFSLVNLMISHAVRLLLCHSVCCFACLFLCWFVCLADCPHVCLSVCLSVCLYACFCLCICLFICSFYVRLCVRLSL